MRQSERQRLEASSWIAVARAYHECARRYSQMLAHFDLTIAQFDVLSAIRIHGAEATPKTIAEELLVTRGNITGLINRLSDRALMTTRQHEYDGRSFRCELTKSGEAILDAAREATQRFIEIQLSVFADRELDISRTMMTRMRSNLETMDPDAIAAGPGRKSARARSKGQ